MTKSSFRLENTWRVLADDPAGALDFALVNLSDAPIRDFKLAYTAQTRAKAAAVFDNASLLRRNANFHQVAPPRGFVLEAGGTWHFSVTGLSWRAHHRTDGAKSAYVTLADGSHHDAAVGDCQVKGIPYRPTPELMPAGEATEPFALLPWPMKASLAAGDRVPVALYPAAGTSRDDLTAIDAVLSLYHRLFADTAAPFVFTPVEGGLPIRFVSRTDLASEGFAITVSSDDVLLASANKAGRQYALTALAQLLHGAKIEPAIFRFPVSGHIEDAPHYGWRGCHLDVARRFFPVADVERLIDILAWFRLNIFHWHLSDDEAWRLEIKALPALTGIGALRGPDEPLLPQLGNGAQPVGGFYTQEEARAVVAQAASLHIEVVPEIDIPGHSTAMLAALPHLADGQEAPESYHSIQGYPNNALNPAIEATYDVLGKVFDEMVTIFTAPFIHVGGDEVADATWMTSPLARGLMESHGIDGTAGLQSYFMTRVQEMLAARGRRLAGWNEVSHGGGVKPEGALLMAWQSPEVGIKLAREGYDVVMTPGQAYYLDMVQDAAWQEPGASWAGTVPPRHTYTYEAAGEFPEDFRPRLKGIQACIWTEYFASRDYFNRLVFPRLPAVAEAAWTPPANKDWLRFAAVVRLSPRL
jgi:hexosaminidase